MQIKKILVRPAVEKKLGADFLFYLEKLREFQKNPERNGFNFEKLHGVLGKQELASIRLSHKVRATLCKINEHTLVVTDILLDHDYDNTQSLNEEEREALAKGIDKGFKVLEADVPEPVADGVVETCERIEFLNHQFIVLNEGQFQAKESCVSTLPLIISGAPGSGKSSVLLAALRQNIESWSDIPEGSPFPKILILAKSAHLITKMSEECDAIYAQERRDDAQIIPRECVEFKTPEMIYKEAHADALCCGEQEFIAWYKNHAKSRNQLAKPQKGKGKGKGKMKKAPQPMVDSTLAELIYQEFHSMSGYAECDDYHKAVSQQFSLFPDKATRNTLWGVFQAYKEYLKNNNQVDLAFQPIELPATYRFIGVDETQDLSRLQIRSLVQAQPKGVVDTLQHHNLLFNVGDHQRLFGSETTIPFIKTLFWERYKDQVDLAHETLLASYRCPKQVIALANAVLQLKYKAIGGSIAHDKNELPFVRTRDDENVEGDIDWLDNESALNELIDLNHDNAQFVVLTSSAFLKKAQDLFGVERVFTAEQFKGLEAKHVLLYKPLDQAGFQAANEVIGPDYVLTNPPQLGKAPEGSIRHSSLFNQLFVAVTRAQGSLTVYQPQINQARYIRESLHRFCLEQKNPAASKQSKPVTSTRGEWLAQAQKLRQQGLEKQARLIEQKWQSPAPESQPQASVPTQHNKTAIPKQSGKRAPENQKQMESAVFNVGPDDLPKKPENTDELLKQLLDNPEMVLEHIIQQENGRHILFHCPIKTTDITLTFVEYLQTKASDAFKKQFFVHLAQLVERYALPKTNRMHCDLLAGLLRYRPKDNPKILPLGFGVIKELGQEPSTQNFIKNYKNKRAKELTNKVIENQDWSSIRSLEHLDALDENYENGRSLLQLLILRHPHRLDQINRLIEKGVNVNYKNDSGETALFNATFGGHVQLIKLLLKANAKAGIETLSTGATVLHSAAGHKNPEVIQSLIKSCKTIINTKDKLSMTAVYYAVQKGNLKALEILIKAGADINISEGRGYTPLYNATFLGNIDAIRILLDAGARTDITTQDGNNVLHMACRKDLNVIRILINPCRDIIDNLNTRGNNPLFYAVSLGRNDLVQALLDAGADITTRYRTGGTILHVAASGGSKMTEALKSILKAGIKRFNNGQHPGEGLCQSYKQFIDRQNHSGLTAAVYAADSGSTELLELFIDAGADFNLNEFNQGTPLTYAVQKNRIKVVIFLLEKGAHFTQSIKSNSKTIVNIAIKSGQEAVNRAKQFALQKGHVLDSEEELMITPLEIAQILGYQEMVTLLESKIRESLSSGSNPNRFFNQPPNDNEVNMEPPPTHVVIS